MLAGNTAPWLFNRTQYANGLGSTTQLHADSNGNLVATVASEGGTAKADSLLLYSAYGSVDSEASGNAGTGIRSNGHSFGNYYADPETGLLYARARYYDPASGQFISRDPVEGEARLPITWSAYQYGRYNPYGYVDPNGEQSTSTLVDNAAEGCGRFTCALYALGKGLYVASTLGFASVHDPMRDAYDEGKISQGQYWGAGVGGGLAVAGLNVATGAAGGALVGAASSTAGRVAVAAVVGASSGAAGDAATQAAHMGGGIQSGYDLQQTATSAGVGGALGAGSVPLANAIKSSLDRRTVARALAKELQTTEPVLAAKTPTIEAAKVRPEVGDTTPTLVAEGPRLRATGEGQSATRTARATPSEGPCCFAPGTLVSTEEGDRPIETIQVGERVWTRMEDGSGEAFLAPVTATHIRDDRPILRLTVEQVALPGEETAQTRTEDLLVTPGHPFYVSGRGFVSVEELQVGDELVSLATQTRLRMRALRLESPLGTTYNLTVETGHTFFVGGLGTWVHNVGPCNTCAGGVCGAHANGGPIEEVAIRSEAAPNNRLTPANFGHTTIAENPDMLRMWNESMKSAASSNQGNGYSRYLDAISNGQPISQIILEKAFGAVNSRFLKMAREAGHDIAQVHHWNYGKKDFPNQIVDSRNLVPVPSREVHMNIHRATSGSSDIWRGPIDPSHRMEIPEWSTILAPR